MESQKENEQTPQKAFAEIEEILKALMDAPGYSVFIARLDQKRDEGGKNLVHYNYKRYQMSYEDTRRAIDEFVKHFRNDLKEL